MSWEDHTNELVATQKLCGAIIVGKEDGVLYAQSGTPSASESEATDLQKFMAGGCQGASVKLGGQKYMLVNYRDDVETAYFVCKQGGLCVGGTNTLFVVGVWSEQVNEKQNAADCNLVIEKKTEEFGESDY